MQEVTYTISPYRGYFDHGEKALLESGVLLESIRSMDFVSDGSVVIVYEIDGQIETLRDSFEAAPEKIVDFAITSNRDPLIAQIRFFPDDLLQKILSTHRSFGVSVEFPIHYVGYDPATIEIVEVGPREELRNRIDETRNQAVVDVKKINRYNPSTGQLFQELTNRQQEVLLAATKMGYYRTPRESTHEDIAQELSCSPSVVGQHLRRIETQLVSSIVPDRFGEDGIRAPDGG